jgi:hypothetical protein
MPRIMPSFLEVIVGLESLDKVIAAYRVVQSSLSVEEVQANSGYSHVTKYNNAS